MMDFDDFNSSIHARPRGLCGLTNIGNTCYMNSALQALSNCHQLTSYFLKTNTIPPSEENTPQTVSKCYRDLIRNMWAKKRPKQLTPSQLMRAIRVHNPAFRGYAQQDTQEFLRCLMDRLHEELKQPIIEFSNQSSMSSNSDDDDEGFHSNKKLLGGNSISEDMQTDYDVERNTSRRSTKRHKTSTLNASKEMNGNDKKTKKEETKYRSIITDVFDGRLLSSVQCLTCNRISNTVETFQDISLPIPSKEDLSRIHTQVAMSCASKVYDDTGWMYHFWEWMKSWFVGPEVQLQDCLSAFFARDELKGDNMYNCEKCKKLRNGIKFSSVQVVPEVLCIHLKRFRQELYLSSKINTYISFPMKNLDVRQFISKECAKSKISTKYDLTAVICHFGSVGGGHYIAFAKNCINNKWYQYNDSFVSEVSEYTVATAEVYVLFYSLKDEESDNFRKSINYQINIDKENLNKSAGISYISREWLDRFNSCVKPGPISNHEVLCRHGEISLLSYSQLSGVLVPVSNSMFQTLFQRFSGGPNITSLDPCSVCQELYERRELERSLFYKLHNRYQEEKESSGNVSYKLSLEWFELWQAFVEGKREDPPGRIDNRVDSVKPDDELYGFVSKETWNFFIELYGGGPELPVLQSDSSEDMNSTNDDAEDEEMPSNDGEDL